MLEEPTKGLLGLVKKPAVVRGFIKGGKRPDKDAVRIVEELLNKMKLDYKIDKVELDANRVRINIIGKDMGLLIGHKGETLNALQFIAGLVLNKSREGKNQSSIRC